MSEAPSLNLYQKLAKIRKPAEVIKKNKKGYGYTYVDEEEILSKITGLMSKYEVSLIPRIVPGTAKVEPYCYGKTKSTKDGKVFEEKVNEVLVHADMEWVWVNDANPEERIVVPWILVGSQADVSQSFGSALTYSSRYFLLKYFNIATSEDDPEQYRRRQQEAADTEDKLLAEKMTEEIHKMVTAFVGDDAEKRKSVLAIVKKYAKDGNYLSIKKSATAAELMDELKKLIQPDAA